MKNMNKILKIAITLAFFSFNSGQRTLQTYCSLPLMICKEFLIKAGEPEPTAPNLDALIKDGVRFDRNYVAYPFMQSIAWYNADGYPL